ncbi:long-chain fatty acid--CoA ligase [Myxococcota bacterium]|nr:long-chain fatty acid--CoA ligase [Myxococcota bacterium]
MRRGKAPPPGPSRHPLDDVRSIPALLERTAHLHGARVAMRRRREALRWGVLTWSEVRQQVHEMAAGLMALGIQKGDRVGILASTRVEWTLADLAILAAGGVTAAVYHSFTPTQVAYLLNNSGARACFVDGAAQLERVRRIGDRLRTLERTLLMDVADAGDDPRVVLRESLIRMGRRLLREDPDAVLSRIATLSPHDPATFVYTSGTTGLPKGVVLTHGMLLSTVHGMQKVLDLGPDDVTVLFLPLSHIFGRLGSLMSLRCGFSTAYAQRMDDLGHVLREIRPTFVFAVPRVYERIWSRVLADLRDLSPLRRRAVAMGLSAARAARAPGASLPGGAAGLGLRLRAGLGDRMVLQPLREQLGGRVRYCISGGAALPQEIAEFFRVAGVEILEGFGLSETSGGGTLNAPGDNVLGTVGRPLPGFGVQVAADGEVLLRGPGVFQEYWGLPADTRDAFDEHGWFRTGDLGEVLPSGHLRITGRKKDLIVTSGGKNIAPQRVESVLRSSPLIAEAVVFGEGRPHLVALVVPHRERLLEACRRVAIPNSDWARLLGDERVRRMLEAEVERANQKLARFESVRRFAVLPEDLTVEDGEVTPTLKVRRTVLLDRYRKIVDGLYEGTTP